MSDLSRFRDHCAEMATATHSPECVDRLSRWMERTQTRRWFDIPDPGPKPECDGCVSDGDRALFAQMAAEVDEYRSPQVDLFGALTDEPMDGLR